MGLCAFCGPGVLSSAAQVTAADYQRAQSLREQFESAAVFVPDAPTWVGTTHRFYYRRSLANGFEFVMVDADTQQKIDVVKGRLIRDYGYDDESATDVLNYVASIFARGDVKPNK